MKKWSRVFLQEAAEDYWPLVQALQREGEIGNEKSTSDQRSNKDTEKWRKLKKKEFYYLFWQDLVLYRFSLTKDQGLTHCIVATVDSVLVPHHKYESLCFDLLLYWFLSHDNWLFQFQLCSLTLLLCPSYIFIILIMAPCPALWLYPPRHHPYQSWGIYPKGAVPV